MIHRGARNLSSCFKTGHYGYDAITAHTQLAEARVASKTQQEIDRIAETLLAAIVEQRLPPGTRLVEARLVAVLGANRNHVRSALHRLASQRLVSVLPNRGAIVSQPSVQEARDVFTARLAIESAVLKLAVARMSDRNRVRLIKQLAVEEGAIASGDRRQMIRESGNFHLLLADIAGNHVFTELLEGLIARTSLIIALYQATPDVACTLEEHVRLAECLIKGREDEALHLMTRHMSAIEHLLAPSTEADRPVDLDQALAGNV